MTTYQVSINEHALFSGSLDECIGYMVERHGNETLEHIYNTGYRIEPASSEPGRTGRGETSLPVSGVGRAA